MRGEQAARLDMTGSTAREAGQPLREPDGGDGQAARVGAAGAPNGPDELHEKHLRQGSKPSTDSVLSFQMIDVKTLTRGELYVRPAY